MARALDEHAVKNLLETIDNFMFDCDGVLWDDFNEIPGSRETLQKLTKLGKRIYYVTNNSNKTREMVVDRCRKLGFPAEEENIVCNTHSTALYLKSTGFKDKLYVIGTPSLGQELDICGIRHTGMQEDVGPETGSGFGDMLNYFSTWKPDSEVKGVVLGFDPSINYQKMVKAATYAKDPNNLFVATDDDFSLPIPGYALFPGNGCLVAVVKAAARREPTVIGKPSKIMFEMMREAHGLEPARTLMVGDRCDSDIMMARNCGLHSLLVLSGCDSLETIEAHRHSTDQQDKKCIPDYYTECLRNFGDLMEL